MESLFVRVKESIDFDNESTPDSPGKFILLGRRKVTKTYQLLQLNEKEMEELKAKPEIFDYKERPKKEDSSKKED